MKNKITKYKCFKKAWVNFFVRTLSNEDTQIMRSNKSQNDEGESRDKKQARLTEKGIVPKIKLNRNKNFQKYRGYFSKFVKVLTANLLAVDI